ncbi:MAG: 50S ribosomal protein L21e [Nanoarchaeota archaeon]|nr:50S ribosomal protein L21e [Nanoarchaeota archaeon]
MVKRIGGMRRKTRYKLKKAVSRKGKISVSAFFKKYLPGDKVYLHPESAVQKGMFHPRFQGKAALVKSKTGSCYKVTINDGGKEKMLIVHPIHLKRR